MKQKKFLFVTIKVSEMGFLMGSISYCYREFMKECIKINVWFTKYEKVYTDEYLKTLRLYILF